MSACTLEWQVFPNNKGDIRVCIVDIFRTKYSICPGTKWNLVELAIVKPHSRFCLRYATDHNWHFYWYNLQSYASVRSARHPSSIPSFLLQLPILSLTHSPHSLIHPRSHPVTHSPTHLPATSTHSFTHSPSHHIYSLTPSLTHSLTFPPHLPTHSPTHLPTTSTHSLTHPLTSSLIHSLIHSLTHSLNHSRTDYNEVDILEIFQSGVH